MNAQTEIEACKRQITVSAFDYGCEEYIGDCYRANDTDGYNSDDAESLYQLRTILQPLLSCTVSEFRALALPTALAIENTMSARHYGGFYYNVSEALSECDDNQSIAGCVQDWAVESHNINTDANDEGDKWADFMREINAAMVADKAEAA